MSTDATTTTSTLTGLAGTLSEITSVLTAGGPVASAVTAVAGAVTEIGKLVAPVLSEDETQKIQNDYLARVRQAQSLLSQPSSPDNAQQLGDFFEQLCVDKGVPFAGGVAGGDERVGKGGDGVRGSGFLGASGGDRQK